MRRRGGGSAAEEAYAQAALELQKVSAENARLQGHLAEVQQEAERAAALAAAEKKKLLDELNEWRSSAEESGKGRSDLSEQLKKLADEKWESEREAAEAKRKFEGTIAEKDTTIARLEQALEEARAHAMRLSSEPGPSVMQVKPPTPDPTPIQRDASTQSPTMRERPEPTPRQRSKSPVPRAPSPRPTNASRGWRMSFSPDWKEDADAKGWHDSRQALARRQESPVHRRPETPRSPRCGNSSLRPTIPTGSRRRTSRRRSQARRAWRAIATTRHRQLIEQGLRGRSMRLMVALGRRGSESVGKKGFCVGLVFAIYTHEHSFYQAHYLLLFLSSIRESATRSTAALLTARQQSASSRRPSPASTPPRAPPLSPSSPSA